MRPTRLARRVEFFRIIDPETSFAHGEKPAPAQSVAGQITLSDIVAHLVDAEIVS
jgi:hypothetical protein